MTDLQTDTQIVGKFRDHSFKIVRSATIEAIEANVSERTVVRRLASAGVKACRPAVKPMPTAQHKLKFIWKKNAVQYISWKFTYYCRDLYQSLLDHL